MSVAGVAAAQTTNSHPFSVRAGYSYLANKDTRDATNNSGFTVGASYDLDSKYLGGMGAGANKVSIDLDYDSHSGNSNTVTSGSLQLVLRTMAGTGAKGGFSPYFGFGAGGFSNRYDIGGFSATKTVFGGTVLVGGNFTQQAFLEVAYRTSGSVDGVRFDTINAVIGFRF